MDAIIRSNNNPVNYMIALLMVFLKNALICKKKVKLINHDCLPILMLLCIMLAYIMLFVAYLMLFVCLTLFFH